MAHKKCVALDSPFSDLLSGTRIDESELNINVPAIHMYSSHVACPGTKRQWLATYRSCKKVRKHLLKGPIMSMWLRVTVGAPGYMGWWRI